MGPKKAGLDARLITAKNALFHAQRVRISLGCLLWQINQRLKEPRQRLNRVCLCVEPGIFHGSDALL